MGGRVWTVRSNVVGWRGWVVVEKGSLGRHWTRGVMRLWRGLRCLEFVYPALVGELRGEQAVEMVVRSLGEVVEPF